MNNGKLFRITNGNENNKYIRLVANQKVIKLIKYSDSIDYTAHNLARSCLSANAFVLYDYLLCHSNGWVWALSSSDVINETPLKMSTYNKAVAELIDTGYLVAHEIDIGSTVLETNAYYFFETPPVPHSDTLPKTIIAKNKNEIDPFAECEEPAIIKAAPAREIMPWEIPQAAMNRPVRRY